MSQVSGVFVGKFIPYPRKERVIKIPDIVYKIEEYNRLSKTGKIRLSWIKKYKEWKNVSKVCRYYGISRKTFYKWYRRYKLFGIKGLEDRSKAPKKTKKPEITREQEMRIIKLRKEYIRYGPIKLAILYERIYGEKISSWKIYRVIREKGLYYLPSKNERLRKKRRLSEKKKRVTELRDKKIEGLHFIIDTKEIHWMGTKRYIIAAIEKNIKTGLGLMYNKKSSNVARDFLKKLLKIFGGIKVKEIIIQTDNGSEFGKYFERECKRKSLLHYWTRVRTPKDNAEVERFIRTIEEEFLELGNYTDDVELFNKNLVEYLIEYNFTRPHQSLGYDTPINFLMKKFEGKLLPMYSNYA